MEPQRFSFSTIFSGPIKLLLLYYTIKFLRISFSVEKGGNNKDKRLKAIAILCVVIVNLVLSVVTHPVVNIVAKSLISPFWVWMNGLTVILLNTSWYYKYDKTLSDAYKPEGVVSQTNMT